MDKLFVVISVARQIDGEYVFVKTEKAFKSAEKADSYLKSKRKEYLDEDGRWKPQLISTEKGEAKCYTEIGVFAVDLGD